MYSGGVSLNNPLNHRYRKFNRAGKLNEPSSSRFEKTDRLDNKKSSKGYDKSKIVDFKKQNFPQNEFSNKNSTEISNSENLFNSGFVKPFGYREVTNQFDNKINISIQNETRVKLNVSGKKFEIFENILDKYPDTLLGSKELRLQFYDKFTNEYFFDRSREAFEGIVFFYQSNGRFEIPSFVPDDVFYEEIKFFHLTKYLGSDCKCNESLLVIALNDTQYEIKKKLKLLLINESSNITSINLLKLEKNRLRTRFYTLNHFLDPEDEDIQMHKNRVLQKIWLILDRPSSTIAGRIVAFICLISVIVSVIVMCLETMIDSNLKSSSSSSGSIKTDNIYYDNYETIKLIDDAASNYSSERRREFFIIEYICNSMFTVEIFLRIISSPDKAKYFKNFTNVIDIVAVVPFWSTILVNNLFVVYSKLSGDATGSKKQSNQYGLSVLRILRLTRVLRVLKLSRHIRALNIMGKILYECLYEIILLLTFLGINIVIFSSLMYYIELHALGSASPFISIPHSFWWAVISFTTIGYGILF